ncbi:UNVERIFIED_CONTAM: hypothetical protein GTU68_026980 [Idotea baltica]|nr:hypothetical protein [Idotea baltica]
MSFDSLGLSADILKALNKKGYTKPSPIQQEAIPAVLKGRDVMAAAQTGTGKTAGFTLPILSILSKGKAPTAKQVRTLIITPTRELAAQILDSVETYGKFLPLTATVVFGGVKINPQIKRLHKGVDILVATPGRLLDLHNQGAVRFDDLEILVLDEADRMLDMGFIHDIRKILSYLPRERQNLLFSATFSPDIRKLAGIDINQLPQVVNFDLPNVPEDYVHRIGRTGRAGERGQAVSLVSADEIKQLRDIERLIGKQLERRLEDGFEPDHDLPASNSKVGEKKSSKPKQGGFNKSGGNGNRKPSKKTNYRNRNKNKNKSGNAGKQNAKKD